MSRTTFAISVLLCVVMMVLPPFVILWTDLDPAAGPLLTLPLGGIGGVCFGRLLARWRDLRRAWRRPPTVTDALPLMIARKR